MGRFKRLLGDASTLDTNEAEKILNPLLLKTEKVESAFQLTRDLFVFTNKRLLFVDKQGVTGSKVHYHFIPYKNIAHYSIEAAGQVDIEAELKIWVFGSVEPIVSKKFNDGDNIHEVQQILASVSL